MSFTDVLVGAGVGFLLGGPAGAAAGGFAAIEAEGQVDATKAVVPSSTSLTTATVGTKAATTEPSFFQQLGAVLGGGVGSSIAGALAPAVTTAVTTGGKVVTTAGCPSGKNQVRTIIQTLNPAGQVIKQKIERGRPFLMARDIVIAKRVFRTVAKVSGRLPRKTVKQSKASMLTDAALDRALRDTLTDDNGNGGKC